MSKIQSTACTISTYCHHAFAALQYGQWHEAENLMRKADVLVAGELEAVDQLPRLTVLSAVVGFEPSPPAFTVLQSKVAGTIGHEPDLMALAQLVSLVAQLAESVDEPAEWVAFLNEEIDNTLSELLGETVGA